MDEVEKEIPEPRVEGKRGEALSALKQASEKMRKALDLVYRAEAIFQDQDVEDYGYSRALAELDKVMKHIKKRLEWIWEEV